eukprot:3394886-Prorocentrum_lima.AAC.1
MCIRDSKGSYRAGTLAHIKRAKLEIADEESEEMRGGSWVARTQNKHKLRVLHRAQHLAAAGGGIASPDAPNWC